MVALVADRKVGRAEKRAGRQTAQRHSEWYGLAGRQARADTKHLAPSALPLLPQLPSPLIKRIVHRAGIVASQATAKHDPLHFNL